MYLPCYGLMGTRERRALKRKKMKWGKTYRYNPRPGLLKRLSRELNISEEEVYRQLFRERAFFLELQK